MALTVPLRCLLGDPQWDPVVVWHKSSAVASTWVIGLLHPGFYLGRELKKVANLPLLKATGTHSVFHWYNYLATIFFPSIGLEVIITHTEAFTKFSLLLLLLSLFSRVRLCATPWTAAYQASPSMGFSSDPMDCSLPGFSIHGILQARTLEWVAISFSNA